MVPPPERRAWSWSPTSSASTGAALQTEEMAFWFLHLNETQEKALESLRSELKAHDLLLPGHDDKFTLLRFLKARQWHVDKAFTMYKAMVHWRKEHDVDNLWKTFQFPELDALRNHYPHFYHKTDRFGRPVYIELLGLTDPCKMLEVTSMEKVLDYHIWTWERLLHQYLPACSKAAGRPIITVTVILDLKGLGFKNFNLTAQKFLHAVSKIDQDYYPESLGAMYIINTPMIFKAVWSFVNPLLEERTRRKIHVLGSDYDKILKELISEDNLPSTLGGKSPCPDTKTSLGPWDSIEVTEQS